jgi:hypothetical protein
MTTYKVGDVLALTPVDSPRVKLHFAVTESAPGAMQLWNGAKGSWESRPFLTQQPDGTWQNGTGIAYKVELA